MTSQKVLRSSHDVIDSKPIAGVYEPFCYYFLGSTDASPRIDEVPEGPVSSLSCVYDSHVVPQEAYQMADNNLQTILSKLD